MDIVFHQCEQNVLALTVSVDGDNATYQQFESILLALNSYSVKDKIAAVVQGKPAVG